MAEKGELCSHTYLPKLLCSHCTGARLDTDKVRGKPQWPPTIHDGRHGRRCTRCRMFIIGETDGAKTRAKYRKLDAQRTLEPDAAQQRRAILAKLAKLRRQLDE